MTDEDFKQEHLSTTFHIPGFDKDWVIDGHVYLASGDQFRWDDGKTYTVERTLFVMEKHSGFGREGLHVYFVEAP